jgi:hypothetical protein
VSFVPRLVVASARRNPLFWCGVELRRRPQRISEAWQ